MANIYFTLSTKGSESGKSELLIRFYHNRINQRAKTRIMISGKYWDEAKQAIIVPRLRVASNEQAKEIKNLHEISQTLSELKAHILDSFITATHSHTEIGKKWLHNVISQFYDTPDDEEQGFFDQWDRFTNSRQVSAQRQAMYKVTKSMLRRYEMVKREQNTNFELSLHAISIDLLTDFESFLRSEHIYYAMYPHLYINEDKPKLRGQNTISDRVSILRTFLMWANNNGLTANDPFKSYRIKPCIYSTPIYISIEEREQLYRAKMPTQNLAIMRDVFVFQCLIGCRVGDLLKLKKSNVVNGAIEYIPHKTKEGRPVTVRVPLCATAKAILDKYADVQDSKLLPFISTQKYNDAIKKCFKAAGLDRIVTRLNTITREPEQRRLYEIASSHMARRTFVGTLYKKVKDPNLIGSLSGHIEGSKAFARYRDIDEEMKRETVGLLDA